jgi:hypothetical protein
MAMFPVCEYVWFSSLGRPEARSFQNKTSSATLEIKAWDVIVKVTENYC